MLRTHPSRAYLAHAPLQLRKAKQPCLRQSTKLHVREQDRSQLDNVPPGRIDLFVDGRTYNPALNQSRAQYPSLHFEAHAIKGQANQIAHPIYLPALAIGPDSAKQVGGNEDVILTLPGLEGFQMKIKANSVTFPDGSRQGLLVVSPVTADKLPMAPPAGGAQFGVPAWTIQPSGTRFDPPIEVQMPNATGEIAGDNLPVVQWDHDLGQYVPMGRATVSGDGAYLITDAGSGITKAGWGGLCRYDECKTSLPKEGCGDCKKVEYKGNPPCPECVFDPNGGPFPKTSQGIDINIQGWGPTGLLKTVFSEVLGVSASASVKVKGEREKEPECCARTQGKKERQTTKGSLGFEAAIEGVVGKATPVGKLLSAAKVEMFVRFKAGGAGVFNWEDDYCKGQQDWSSAILTGQVTGAGEAGLRFGKVDPGPQPVSGVAIEGFAGLEAQGQIQKKISGPVFAIESSLSLYVQLDVVTPAATLTLVRQVFELSKTSSVDVRSVAP